MPVNKDGAGLKEPKKSQQDIPRFATHKQQYDWIHNGSEHISNYQSLSGAEGRNTQRTKNLGWCQRQQTQGNIWWPQSTWPASNPTQKKHRFLAFYTGYYSNVYSISGYRILWIFCAHIMMLPPLTLKKMAVRNIYP